MLQIDFAPPFRSEFTPVLPSAFVPITFDHDIKKAITSGAFVSERTDAGIFVNALAAQNPPEPVHSVEIEEARGTWGKEYRDPVMSMQTIPVV